MSQNAETQTEIEKLRQNAQELLDQYREVQGEVVAEYLTRTVEGFREVKECLQSRPEFLPPRMRGIRPASGLGIFRFGEEGESGDLCVVGLTVRDDGLFDLSFNHVMDLPKYITEHSLDLFIEDIEHGRKFANLNGIEFKWGEIGPAHMDRPVFATRID